MVRETEGWFVLNDGMELFEKTWEPLETPKAHLIFIHGFNDRSEIQYHLFPTLTSAPYNITCHAIDQRGWGKSVHHPSQRGLTGPTPQVLSDINDYITHVLTTKISDIKTTPLFLMGHSMGGQQVLHYLLSTSPQSRLWDPIRSQLAGAVVEAPYIELDPASQPSRFLVMAGKLAAMISPKSVMRQDLDERYITRDPAVNRAWKDDPLCHDHGTLEGMRDMIDRGARLVNLSTSTNSTMAMDKLGLGRNFPCPVFWAHGTKDRITAFEPSKRLIDALQTHMDGGKIVFKPYEDAYHKIHAEPDGVGVGFARDVGQWILGIVENQRISVDVEMKAPDVVSPGKGGELKEDEKSGSNGGGEADWNRAGQLSDIVKSKL